MDAPMSDLVGTALTLDQLPSELRRLIVSFLSPLRLRPGSKKDLKNANLAHRCLHEWATEYIFHEMTLLHVLPGISSQLERFSLQEECIALHKLVKRIEIRVPPAIRWENIVDIGDPELRDASTHLMLRFMDAIDLKEVEEHELWAANTFHDAMFEPFTDPQRWTKLFRLASLSWLLILERFPNVERIDVGCCRLIEHPSPTATNLFLQRSQRSPAFHDRLVGSDEWPFDESINRAWASCHVLNIVPRSVRALRLTWAHTDNLHGFATVNHLLDLGYSMQTHSSYITKLNLTIMGVPGTHGSRGWQKNAAGSATGVRYWRKAINSMESLEYLEIRDEQGYDKDLHFTDLSMSDQDECILDWFLPGLKPPRLRALALDGFRYNYATIAESLRQLWPHLDSLTFANPKLVLWGQGDIETNERVVQAVHTAEQSQFLQGHGWCRLCEDLDAAFPEGRIILSNAASGIGYEVERAVDAKCVQKLRESGVVYFDGSSCGPSYIHDA